MTQNAFSLEGKTALITGAGKGIGKAVALAYAEAGAQIICVARTQTDVDQTAAQARQFGIEAQGISCDVRDESALKSLVDQSFEHFAQIDLLVNNAGGAFPNDPLRTQAETFNADFNFNVTSAFNLSRMLAPRMLERGSGCIINISSAAARYSQKGFSSYGTAKAALSQLSKLLAADFAPTIRVNAIAPGTIMTDALSQFLDDDATQKIIDLTPLRCMGQVEDIANAALFLASPAARWITGKVLEVDGGAESTTWPF